MKIKLSETQICAARLIGEARQLSAEKRSSKSAFPEQWAGQFLDNHKNAACAELAVSVALQVKTELGVDVFSVPDIDGTRIDVRWARNRDLCKVTPRDIGKNRIIVGTTGTDAEIEILGWIEARDAPYRCKGSAKEPWCWFVDEFAWEPIETLTGSLMRPRDGEKIV